MKQLRRIITLVIVLAAIFVGVLFALQNREPVALDLLVYTLLPAALHCGCWSPLPWGRCRYRRVVGNPAARPHRPGQLSPATGESQEGTGATAHSVVPGWRLTVAASR